MAPLSPVEVRKQECWPLALGSEWEPHVCSGSEWGWAVVSGIHRAEFQDPGYQAWGYSCPARRMV